MRLRTIRGCNGEGSKYLVVLDKKQAETESPLGSSDYVCGNQVIGDRLDTAVVALIHRLELQGIHNSMLTAIKDDAIYKLNFTEYFTIGDALRAHHAKYNKKLNKFILSNNTSINC